jgi:beta-glucanase (GH16 family)
LRISYLTFCTGVLTQCIQNPAPSSKPVVFVIPPPEWELVWEDDFSVEQLDSSKWNYQLAHGCDVGYCGWGNAELQYYTNRIKNVHVDSGTLKIEAYQEKLDFDSANYTSARITTAGKGDWKYGKIVVRAKIPQGGDGSGAWPAIWMMPTDTVYGRWPKSGEIDIMEAYGPNMDTIHQSLHWWGGDGTKGSYVQTTKAKHPQSWAEDFHEYSIIWTKESLTTFIDGQAYMTRKNTGSVRQYPYIEKFYLILNIAIGGNGFPKNVPFGLTTFPQTMVVDYVRVYHDKSQPTENL